MASRADDDLDAPRARTGPNPQHLLATLLGEYLDSADAPLPPAALDAVLAEFGFSASSARAALNRLARRGLVEARGRGRATVYHLTTASIARQTTMHRFLAYGTRTAAPDDRWSAVSYSLPESRHAERHAVRKVLTSAGFARLYDSVWISPEGVREEVLAALRDVLGGVDAARWSVMRVRFEDVAGTQGPADAYDLAGVAQEFRAFLEAHTPVLHAVRVGAVDDAGALVARTRLMDQWRSLVLRHPNLPADVVPADWPVPAARDLLVELHTALGPGARRRLVEVAAPSWPDAARWVTYFVAAADPAQPPRRG